MAKVHSCSAELKYHRTTDLWNHHDTNKSYWILHS